MNHINKYKRNKENKCHEDQATACLSEANKQNKTNKKSTTKCVTQISKKKNDKEHNNNNNNNSLTQQIRTVILSRYGDDKNIQQTNK